MFQYLQIFYRPGLFIEEVLSQTKTHTFALRVAFLFSALQSIPIVMSTGLIDPESGAEGMTGGGLIPLKVIIGGILGLGVFYIFALALKTFGRWFGAKVESKEVRTGLGIGLIPWTVLFLVFFVSMALVDPRLIISKFFPFFFVGFIYGFTILLIALSKTLKIGFLKTFLLFILAYATTFFPLLTLVRLYFGA
ncbi:MAG: Uncharacterised protein [Puniceicoccaceae bacterium MED-G32]|jgi:hypothetical protein|nr:MAG: Uncharacterised protein [Puniceicoccaceae bacterium MED-G32]|tara:strand:+ start:5432 stop:6010 length:579 start_codon:yes stop_codon:yes gene_type:complete